jgi:precorrin-2 dehydrogenase / sirohydrochlorin ferrochelatase
VSVVDYPVCLRLLGKPVLVVGGGAVALGRVRGLLAAGASVRVVAATAAPELQQAAERGELVLERRRWRPEDLQGAMLVVVAVDDPLVSAQVVAAARVRGLWCTAVDQPALCDFTMPSVGRRGPITVAVSTSGKAPALAAQLRRRFEAQIWPEDLAIANGVEALRAHLPAGPWRMQLIKRFVAVAVTATSTVRRLLTPAEARSSAAAGGAP